MKSQNPGRFSWRTNFSNLLCAAGAATALAASAQATVTIQKIACPEIICDGVSTPVTYTYFVATVEGVFVTNVVVIDDTCGPGGPNTPIQLASGDANNNGILEFGELWVYSCSTTLSQATHNTATVTGSVNGSTTESDTDAANVYAIRALAFPAPCGTEFCARLIDFTGAAVDCACSWTGPNGQPVSSVPCGNDPTGCCCITLDGDDPIGNYQVTFDCAGSSACPGGGTVSGSCEMTFTGPPAPSCSISMSGCPFPRTLTANVSNCGNCTYQWGTGSAGNCTPLPGENGPTLVVNAPGDYCLTVTANGGPGGGCSSECDVTVPACDVLSQICRVTGGGHDLHDDNKYTFGGQAGAPTASQPQPWGEWTHHSKPGSPAGKWVFHAGTASAPDGTEIDLIECCDPGNCLPARHAPNKQIDFEGIGTFKNLHSSNFPDGWANAGGPDRTYHWFEVHIEDLGEPGNSGQQGSPPEGADCPSDGHNCSPADCACPDFYRITIYRGFVPSTIPIPPGEINTTEVMYTVHGYIDGGNFQIHPAIGDLNGNNVVTQGDLTKLMNNFGPVKKHGVGDLNGDGNVNGQDVAILMANMGPVVP